MNRKAEFDDNRRDREVSIPEGHHSFGTRELWNSPNLKTSKLTALADSNSSWVLLS